jgi:DNA primase
LISRLTIDQVFDTARVEEVIRDFVQLKKAGSNYKGLSPFTDERSPSFMVSPVKQIWKDFSSGKGGNVVTFLMEHEHFSYPEAIKYLAKKYNIEIEETEQTDEQKQQASERESLYLINEFASKYFQDTMHNTAKGKAIGLSYFKERGFTPETIQKFGLGYALDEWTAFTDTAVKKGYQLEYLEKTGLTIVKESQDAGGTSKTFDRFKGRVMFPIHSMSGRILGFGGRILTNDKKAAKYLNSPESEVYHKSKVLYGIYLAKKHIAKEDNCFLVEGYTDVIQFNQTGIKNVVASSGTALTPDQIRLINRLTNNITVLFDGDAAGIRASLRGIDMILEQGMNVRVCTFPEGEDPDSYAKSNSLTELQDYLADNATDFIEFKAKLLSEDSKNDPIKKANTIRDIINSISKIPDPIKRELYVKECSQIMDVSQEVLVSTLAQIGQKQLQDANKAFQKEQKAFEVVRKDEAVEKVDVQYQLERKIIEILLLYGNLEADFEDMMLQENEDGELVLEPIVNTAKVYEKVYLDLQEDEMEFTNPLFKSIYFDIIDKLNQNPELTSDDLSKTLDPKLSDEVSSILMDDEKYELHDWERKNIFPKQKKDNVAQLVNETILNLRCHLISKKITELSNQTKEDLKMQYTDVLEEVLSYKKLDNLLSRKLQKPL